MTEVHCVQCVDDIDEVVGKIMSFKVRDDEDRSGYQGEA